MPTFKYGGISLTKVGSTHHLVPKSAREIIMPTEYKKSLAIAVKNNLPVLLEGEAGTGKTSAARYIAYRLKQPYVRVSMTGYTTPDELIGSKSAKDGATYYEDGVVVNAMKIGAVLVLDEINATPPDSAFILHGLLDEDRQITLPNGDVIKPHPNFRVFATMNPEYEGTKSLNRAFRDRFPIILQFNPLDPGPEAQLIADTYKIDSETTRLMVTVASVARKAYKEEKTITHVSTRSLMQWAELMSCGMDRKLAYHVCIARKATECDQGAFMDYYNAVFREKSSVVNPLDDPQPTIVTQGELNRLKDKAKKTEEELSRAKQRVNELADSNINYVKQVKDLQTALANATAANDLEKISQEAKAQNDTQEFDGFKLGDFVRAKDNDAYSTTNHGWTGVVVGFMLDDSNNFIRMKVRNTEGAFDVEPKYFDKIK